MDQNGRCLGKYPDHSIVAIRLRTHVTRVRSVGYCGIKKYTTRFSTTKIGPFSIRSSLKNVSLVSLSVMKKMQRGLRKRWMIGRAMPAKTPRKPPSKTWPIPNNHEAVLCRTGNIIVDSDLEVCYLGNEMLRHPVFPKHCHSPLYHLDNLPFLLRRARTAVFRRLWTTWTHRGEVSWANCSKWA